MPTWKHGAVEGQIGHLVRVGFPDFKAGPEVTVQIRPTRFLVPDLIIQRGDRIQDPYPVDPVHVCVEILSPSDRFAEVLIKCQEYHDWGVEMTWVVAPEARRAWEYRKGQLPREIPPEGSLTAEGISIPLSEIFAGL